MNTFRIEAGSPSTGEIRGGFAEDLAGAIEMAYPLETEDAIISWCGISFPLSYKYDVSVIIEDVIEMLEQCAGSNVGSIQVNFGSNTFNADWSLDLEVSSVVVSAHWNSVVGNCEVRLNECPPLIVGRRVFVEQWLAIVDRALVGVGAAGIRLGDADLLSRGRKLLGNKLDLPMQ